MIDINSRLSFKKKFWKKKCGCEIVNCYWRKGRPCFTGNPWCILLEWAGVWVWRGGRPTKNWWEMLVTLTSELLLVAPAELMLTVFILFFLAAAGVINNVWDHHWHRLTPHRSIPFRYSFHVSCSALHILDYCLCSVLFCTTMRQVPHLWKPGLCFWLLRPLSRLKFIHVSCQKEPAPAA